MAETLYKVLAEDGSARMGVGRWHLPTNDAPGDWMPEIQGELMPCQNGYHLCRGGDLLQWMGPAIFEAEYSGEIVKARNKIVVRRARLVRRCPWNARTIRLFAADCARRVLHLYEQQFPGDPRPRRAIDAVRHVNDADAAAYATAAADDAAAVAYAAYAAAAAAAVAYAAYADDDAAAAYVAYAAAAADDAAAAYAAADDAAYAYADDAAARQEERAWQAQRLLQYLAGEVGNDG